MERLDRFLADESSYSRSEVKKLIRAGRVLVNDSNDVRPEMKIDPEKDSILADGIRIRQTGRVCIMMNKPSGVLSATEDRHGRTVVDLLSEPYADKLFPAGRLDKDTEGLLLLTNDGRLAHDLLSPGRHVEKTYFVIAQGIPEEKMIRQFNEGIDIGEKRITLPAQLTFLSKERDFSGTYGDQTDFFLRSLTSRDYDRCGNSQFCCVVSVTEGKFHQIKRMFHACGKEVCYLKRIGMSKLALDPALEPGAYRQLTAGELAILDRTEENMEIQPADLDVRKSMR